MIVKTLCPICKQTLAADIYADRSVGINFDYDIVENQSNCTCDVDEQLDEVYSIDVAQYIKLKAEFQQLV